MHSISLDNTRWLDIKVVEKGLDQIGSGKILISVHDTA